MDLCCQSNVPPFYLFIFLSITIFIYLFIYYLFYLLYFTLQYCIGFAIHWHESTMGVHAIPNMTTGKTIALTRWTFVGKVMSLLFNMLSRLVTGLLPRNKCLLISWLQSPSAMILEPKEIKYISVSIVSPICLPRSDGIRRHDLCFLNAEFYASFFTLLFHFHQEIL